MNIKKLVVEFGTVFAVALVTSAIVTFLWDIIGHGASAVDWETSFAKNTLSNSSDKPKIDQ
jgi:hypothetical protein